MTNPFRYLSVKEEGAIVHVRLERPDVHNAFNAELIIELRDAFDDLRRRATGEVRAVVLSGAGPSFCAGADVNWMRKSLDLTREENTADAVRMAEMFSAIDSCPVAVVCRIQGAAFGGGAGLAAVSDVVIAEENAIFAFSEAKLGIAPAVISPFVLQKIGTSHARSLFFTAERFSAARAMGIGLVHTVVPYEHLDEEVHRATRELLSSSPYAIARSKELIATVQGMTSKDATPLTTQTIAELRTSAAGQEGLRAFLGKRKPDWSA